MSILTATQLGKFFGAEEIFADIAVEIAHGARIALVGANGAGKTTLLNILIGRDVPTEGSVYRAKGIRIGHLPQRPELSGADTLWEEVSAGAHELRAMEASLTELEHRLAAETDDALHTRLLNEYGDLQERFTDLGGYTLEARTKSILQGLGFKPDDYSRPIVQMSGGQKTRALLGRLLLEQPDLLALDEPTNHLDIDAVEWLEGFLKDFPGAVLVVSHDRYFMDTVANTVWELDFGTIETYRGNYSAYVRQRGDRHERLLKEFQAQQAFIAKETDYIRRNIAGQNTKQAQGRRTRLERMIREGGLVQQPRSRDVMKLRMNGVARSGDQVVITRGVVVGYADAPAPLFRAPDIILTRGEVAALIGANGAGKSTFVKTIIGELPALSGEVRLGAAVQVGYFAQAHELLDPNHTLIDEIMSAQPMQPATARDLLARFMFTGDDVFRTISSLSGGERGRVALAKLTLTGANLLLLDEPTNHLDIASQEVLQHVLADFAGTILLVSHDRYLIEALATQIWAISPGKLDVFNGTYREYLAARESQRAGVSAANGTAPEKKQSAPAKSAKKHGLNPHDLQKRIAHLEAQIPMLESQLATISDALAQASVRGDGAKVRALSDDYQQVERELAQTMTEWETLLS
jgi:ATP-binding cassette subfamily F protein 3